MCDVDHSSRVVCIVFRRSVSPDIRPLRPRIYKIFVLYWLPATSVNNSGYSMGFAPGTSGNPNGRPSGARNRRTQEVLDQIIKSGKKDPLLALSELITNAQDESVRASAASMLAPYLHGKLQSIPVPRFVEAELQLPPLTSLESALESIAKIQAAVAGNQLDIQNAQELIAMIEAFVRTKNIMEITTLQERLDAIEQSIANNPQAQLPHIEGGLPVMRRILSTYFSTVPPTLKIITTTYSDTLSCHSLPLTTALMALIIKTPTQLHIPAAMNFPSNAFDNREAKRQS